MALSVGNYTVGTTRVEPGVDARYSAFPSMTRLADGRILMVWYEGTDHVASRDGLVRAAYSSDEGSTWQDAYTALYMQNTDLRDPCVATSLDGTKVYLTYFKGSNANPANGFYFRAGDATGKNWGQEVRIDAHAYAGGCAPVVPLPNGKLLATWYGKASTATETKDSVWVSTSDYDGLIWSPAVRVVSGASYGTDMQEPYAVAKGNKIVITHRYGNFGSIGVVVSHDNGSSWETTQSKFAGSGRPNTIFTSDGTLICAYRQIGSQQAHQHGMIRWSKDDGATWSGPQLLEPTANNFWVYSAFLETEPGKVLAASAVEVNTNSADLSLRSIRTDIQPDVNGSGPLVAMDTFDRPATAFLNGSRAENGAVWASQGGAVIKDGVLEDSTASGPKLHYLRTLSTSQDVEADFLWEGNAGVCLVTKLQDTGNYFMAAVETGGTAGRIYKIAGGVATQLATGGVSIPSGVWHKMRFVALGGNLRFYIDDILIATANNTSFAGAGYAGFRIGTTAAGTVHKVRNFTARQRSEINT